MPTIEPNKEDKLPSSTSISSQKGPHSRKNFIFIVVIVFTALALLYIITGSDPAGIFTPQPTEMVSMESGWWQVYFTDPVHNNDPTLMEGSIEEKLINYIDNAQGSIHIAAFEFNLTPVAEALIEARNRGVQVRWVTDDEYGLWADEEEGHGQFALLKKEKIKIKDDGKGALMHNKFIIFDQQIVWTGSTNLTRNGIFRNNNNVIIVNSPELAAVYEEEFSEMWQGKFGPKSPSTVENQSVEVFDTPIKVLFSAEDEVIDKLIPLIENATSSIKFMAFSFTHDALGDAVLARAQNGVNVSGIFETRGSETEYSELSRMVCEGLNVRQDGNPATFHHKVFIIDNEIVITGSFNFSNNANDSNDENVIILTNGEIAREYVNEFITRWEETEEIDPVLFSCN